MDESTQAQACRDAKLFSRVEPAHKSKIVGYLQKDGQVSAMVSLSVKSLLCMVSSEILLKRG